MVKLERAISDSDIGARFQTAVNYDAALRMGLTVTPHDIDVQTFYDLRILNDERTRFENQKRAETQSKNN